MYLSLMAYWASKSVTTLSVGFEGNVSQERGYDPANTCVAFITFSPQPTRHPLIRPLPRIKNVVLDATVEFQRDDETVVDLTSLHTVQLKSTK